MDIYDRYVRVSRVMGRDDEGESYQSPTIQKRKGKGWIEANGFKLGITKEDEDESGAKEIRPGLEFLIGRIERGESAGIVVSKLDRFGRTVEGILKNYKRVRDAGGVVVFVKEGIDPTTVTGKAMFVILSLFAEIELDQRRESWLDSRTGAIERGIHIAAVPPTGYAKGEGGRLVPDPLVAPQVRAAFKLSAGGMSRADVIDRLNEMAGRHWHSQLLYAVLKNRAYLGEAYSGDIVNPDAHDPLTDHATFLAAQGNGRVGPLGDSEALLKGLVRCQGCRRVMCISYAVPKGQEKDYERHAFYYCKCKHSNGKCESPARVKASTLESGALEFFWQLAGDRILMGAEDTAELAKAEGELVEAEAERKRFQESERLQALGDAYVEGLEARVAIERAAGDHVAKIRGNTAHPELRDVESLRELWETLEPAHKHELIASVIGAVYVERCKSGRVKAGESVEEVEARSLIFAKGDEPKAAKRGAKEAFPIEPLEFASHVPELVAA